MRIVLDLQACQTSGSRNRGIGRYSMSLSQAMARQSRGHEMFIVLNDRFPDTIDPIQKAFDGLLPQKSIRTFNMMAQLSEANPANTWRVRAAERIREDFLAGLSPDFVHLSSLFEGLGDDAVTSVGNIRGEYDTAVTLYDLIPLLNKETYLTNARVRDWYYRKLQVLKNAELLLSISEHSRREALAALQLPEDRVVNISSAVDPVFRPRILSFEETARLRNRYGFSKPFLMYTGGVDHRKNIEGLIEAFAALPREIKTQYQLAIVCSVDDDNRRRLESLASKFGLGKTDVVFTGYVPEDDLVALYNTCALFVFPSLHEGFGLPVLEAMSCGAAVIGSNTSSIPEVLGREDALFNPRDISAIAHKIHSVLINEDFKASLQRHGRQQAKQFSWDASAQRALDAFEHCHDRRNNRIHVAVNVPQQRPRLAYVSPLPPEKSGIADYSAELLPELAAHYDIEVVVTQNAVTDPWIAANFPVRSVEWFSSHAESYDRILYHFGNSGFHQHMFALLERHPGVVVLHDFFMSGVVDLVDFSGAMPGAFDRALYESHGYPALMARRKLGREAAMWQYPCNKSVLNNALGIIVHSKFSMQLAEAWYGEGTAAHWKLIPLLRAMPEKIDRMAARQKLELSDDDFLVCSFGLLGPIKLNDRLLETWVNSPLAQDKRCHLVFVGENPASDYGKNLLQKIEESDCQGRIQITGFASQELYRTYLAAADAAVQLRTKSRGETSAAIFDCMAYGVPTIINMHGSSADLPDDALIKLPDEFSIAELSDSLVSIRNDAEGSRILANRAIDYIRRAHHPAKIGMQYRDAIEVLSTDSYGARYRQLINSIATIAAPVRPAIQDITAAAGCIVANRPAGLPRQLLVDVSSLMPPEANNSRHTLVRNMLGILLNEQNAEYRVEPIYASGGCFKYARNFTLDLIGASDAQMEDTAVDATMGDIFLGLYSAPAPSMQALLTGLRHKGISQFFVSLDSQDPAKLIVDVQSKFAEPMNYLEYAKPHKEISASAETIHSRIAQIHQDYLEQIVFRRMDQNRDTNAAKPLTLKPQSDAEAQSAQMLVDVTFLARHNLNSGIQRVVHHVLIELLTSPPKGYRVEPVYDADGYYAYAREFAARITGNTPSMKDEPVRTKPGDIFLGLDLSPDAVPKNQRLFKDFRKNGVQVFFVVYDLLPVLRPDVFPPNAQATFVEWLETIIAISDGLVGISRSVADEIVQWLETRRSTRTQPLHISYFHLGAEIPEIETSQTTLTQPHARPTILMVGTVEPRKGYTQALSAFEKLWAQGVNVDLAIVGRQGWMVEPLAARLRSHTEHDKHLFWFEGASDDMLLKLYETSSALLLASEGEGFGLPLIEAAHRKLPIIARDIPVFREVAGKHAFYFNGTTGDGLCDALSQWLLQYAENRVPSSEGIRCLTWAESAQQLLNSVVGQNWYRTVSNKSSTVTNPVPPALARNT